MSFFTSISDSLKSWRGAYRFRSTPRAEKGVVFYSESRASAPHLCPLLDELLFRGQSVHLLASHHDDPMANIDNPNLHTYIIGSGSARTWVFSTMDANVVVTTTPDLQTMQLKRSNRNVFYIYVHHSLVSTHMAYRPAAFDHFDAIMCSGPHHVRETRAAEKLDGLPPKTLVEHGYGRLDSLIANRGTVGDQSDDKADDYAGTILIAPSWGDNSILQTHGRQLVGSLIDAGYRVIVRPHPQTTREHPELISEMAVNYKDNSAFTLDYDPTNESSMGIADLMISDWSGVALEFAYGFEKPVLFVDLPRKVNNPAYGDLDIDPFEVLIRDEIGEILPLDRIGDIADRASSLITSTPGRVGILRASYSNRVFNIGNSHVIGADFIQKMTNRPN